MQNNSTYTGPCPLPVSLLSAQFLELFWLSLRVGPLKAPISGEGGGEALHAGGEGGDGTLPTGGEGGGGGGAGRGSLAGSGCVLDTRVRHYH